MRRGALPILLLLLPSLAGAQSIMATGVVQSTSTFTNVGGTGLTASAPPGTTIEIAPASGARFVIVVAVPTEIVVPDVVTLVGSDGTTIILRLTCAFSEEGHESSSSRSSRGGQCSIGRVLDPPNGEPRSVSVSVGGVVAGTETSMVPAGSYAGTIFMKATFVVF